MNNMFREYIENLFNEAPQTPAAVEMKEEFIQNLNDKYDDLISEGKSEEAAFNIAVASMGDVTGLVNELKGLQGQNVEYQERNKKVIKQRSIITAIAVALYILCPVPIIVIGNNTGLVAMFVMIAAATGLFIYNGTNKPAKGQKYDTMVDEFQEWRGLNEQNRGVYKSVTSAVWSLGLVAYFLVSFFTGAWHLTWLIFLVIGAINGIIKAIFDLQR